jgi:GDSL-like Lipase/Acylhydrolase
MQGIRGVDPKMIRGKLSQVITLAIVNLAALMVIVIGCELAFGNWFSPFVPPGAAVVDQDYTYRQTLYNPPGLIRYVRDKFGLRGVHEPLNQVQVVTVGGSTTDQRYVSEGQTWQDVWRKAANVAVANAGVDGMSSFGHIVAVADWLHKIPGFKPKYYLHYVGVNDASLAGDKGKLGDLSEEVSSWRHLIIRRSVLAKAVAKLWFRASGPREVTHRRMKVPPLLPLGEMKLASLDTHAIEKYVEQIYKPNLRRLVELSAPRGEKVIFVSQPANPALVRWQDGKTYVTTSQEGMQHWALALGMINRANREVCTESADCQFADVAGKVSFAPNDFYDLVHNTPSGARKIGEFLAQELSLAKRAAIAAPAH